MKCEPLRTFIAICAIGALASACSGSGRETGEQPEVSAPAPAQTIGAELISVERSDLSAVSRKLTFSDEIELGGIPRDLHRRLFEDERYYQMSGLLFGDGTQWPEIAQGQMDAASISVSAPDETITRHVRFNVYAPDGETFSRETLELIRSEAQYADARGFQVRTTVELIPEEPRISISYEVVSPLGPGLARAVMPTSFEADLQHLEQLSGGDPSDREVVEWSGAYEVAPSMTLSNRSATILVPANSKNAESTRNFIAERLADRGFPPLVDDPAREGVSETESLDGFTLTYFEAGTNDLPASSALLTLTRAAIEE